MKKTDGKHTPGPWMAKGLYIEGENRVIARSVLLAKSNLGGEEAENELGKANARLIAAAPKMESVLYALLAWHENPDAPDDPWSWARSVLSQVAGGDE